MLLIIVNWLLDLMIGVGSSVIRVYFEEAAGLTVRLRWKPAGEDFRSLLAFVLMAGQQLLSRFYDNRIHSNSDLLARSDCRCCI